VCLGWDTHLFYCVQHVLAQLGYMGFNIKQVEIPNICKYDHIEKVRIILGYNFVINDNL